MSASKNAPTTLQLASRRGIPAHRAATLVYQMQRKELEVMVLIDYLDS